MNPIFEGYDKHATRFAKFAVLSYTATCAFVAVFKDWGFGALWLPVWFGGALIAPIAIAPFVIFEWLLLKRGYWKLPQAISIGYVVGSFPAAYYALKLVFKWMNS